MKTVKVLILYSVIYYVAYRCKIAGFSVLSSILFLSLAFFLFLTERKREQTALPLTGLFALGILGGEGIAVLQLSTLSSNWTGEMWLSLFFSYFSYAERYGSKGSEERGKGRHRRVKAVYFGSSRHFFALLSGGSVCATVYSPFYDTHASCLLGFSLKRAALFYHCFCSGSLPHRLFNEDGKEDSCL